MSLGEMFVSGLSAVWGGGTMFLMVIVAIVLGTIFGALPGVSATLAVALGRPSRTPWALCRPSCS